MRWKCARFYQRSNRVRCFSFLSTRPCWRFYKLGACGKPKTLVFSVSSWISSFQPVLSWPFPPSFLSFFSFPFPLFLLLSSKTIKVRVIDDEEYEKNKTFYIEIGEPRLMESNDTKGQEGGEPWWPPSPRRVRHHVRRRCMFSTHEGDSESFFTSWCVFSLTENMWQVVDHLIPPHPPRHLIYVCVCVCVCCFLFFYVCVRIRYHGFCLPCMHSPPPSMCTCVYVCVPCRKSITIRILDREEYNKQSSFYLLLDTPQWRRSGKERTGVTANQHWDAPHEVLENPESTGRTAESAESTLTPSCTHANLILIFVFTVKQIMLTITYVLF